jgi:hypothetical protein
MHSTHVLDKWTLFINPITKLLCIVDCCRCAWFKKTWNTPPGKRSKWIKFSINHFKCSVIYVMLIVRRQFQNGQALDCNCPFQDFCFIPDRQKLNFFQKIGSIFTYFIWKTKILINLFGLDHTISNQTKSFVMQ